MASPDEIPCFESLPDDLVGVILGQLDFVSALRLTQACPNVRRLIKGERAVAQVFGPVSVRFFCNIVKCDVHVTVSSSGFRISEVKAATTDENEDDAASGDEDRSNYVPESEKIADETSDDDEAGAGGADHAERQPSARIAHLLEWIRVRARAFTEIVFKAWSSLVLLPDIAISFLRNVPNSYRGKISFDFTIYTTGMKTLLSNAKMIARLARLSQFLTAWRALTPAYECGLMLRCAKISSDLLLASLQAAPPLSSLNILWDVDGFRIAQGLDTSRLKIFGFRNSTLETLPSEDVLPPTVHDLSLFIFDRCWSSLGAFLAPLHRLTALDLDFESANGPLDSSMTLAPFTVLPNLRRLRISTIWGADEVSPSMGSDYWQSSIVLPALEELCLEYAQFMGLEAQGHLRGPVPTPSSRWPTLLANLQAPNLQRLEYELAFALGLIYEDEVCYLRTVDLPLGRFPRLRFFDISVQADIDLPDLRAEIATLRHLERPADPQTKPSIPSMLFFYAVDPVPEDEVEAWKLDLGSTITKVKEVYRLQELDPPVLPDFSDFLEAHGWVLVLGSRTEVVSKHEMKNSYSQQAWHG